MRRRAEAMAAPDGLGDADAGDAAEQPGPALDWEVAWPPPDRFTGGEVAAGNVLTIFAHQLLKYLPPKHADRIKRRVSRMPARLTAASGCSGSGMDECCFDALEEAFRGIGKEFHVPHLFRTLGQRSLWAPARNACLLQPLRPSFTRGSPRPGVSGMSASVCR